MKANIAKWGNSLAVRLPRSLAADAGLHEGTSVDMRLDGQSLVITTSRPRYQLAELLAQLKSMRRRKTRHQEVDWGPPQGEEQW
jgi:antitoxin MazE